MATAPPRNLGRLSEIAQVAARHGFGYLFENRRLRRRHPDDETPSQRGAHLRAMFDELGPTFVKFGQLLSTRPDILPPDIIAELRGLQDDVTPFTYEEAETVIQQELGLSIERLFLEFDPVPIAAASIGQVHRAILPNGRRVAVKVQRPNAPDQIEADISLLYQAARLAKDRLRRLDFIDARGIVDEFARNIRQELDYRGEARNADRFRHDFAGHPRVRIPRVYWSYTRARVLALEFLPWRELQKPLVRTSDVRGTFVVDHRGRVLEELPAGAEGVLHRAVPTRDGLTPYGRWGDAVVWLWIAAALGGAFLTTLARGPASRHRLGVGGQVLPLATVLLVVVGAAFYLMVNSGQAVQEKIRVTNAADAAAYSAACRRCCAARQARRRA
jgi:hypothetical protein